MKRGTIYWINLEDCTPPEFGKTRPGVVISNSSQNVELDTVIIVPLSTKAPEIWPLRMKVSVAPGKDSFAVVPGLRQISKKRLIKMIGVLSPIAMERLAEAVHTYLSDF